MTAGAIGRPAGDDRGGRTAFQGAPGAFSHEACVALRPWDVHVPFETFAEAITAVKSGDCDCALIPVENSTIGVVEPAATLVAEAGPPAGAGVQKLDAFVVRSEREGNAKALMEQRRSMNLTNSLSSDVFGDVAEGSVGEFLKNVPGVDVVWGNQ